MVDFKPRHVKIVNDRAGRLIYAVARKPYTRTHPYPAHIQRIPPLQREKAAVIKLRKLGYPTNMISRALGRSTSYVHRILKTALHRFSIPRLDMRKLPGNTRLRCAPIRWSNLQRYMPLWVSWICGEGERPP